MPFADNQGKPIYYQVEGQGEPLVFLHGFLNDHQIWYDLSYVKSLKEHYKLILIDLRGYGKSYKPHKSDEYFLVHKVRDVCQVLDELRVFRAHIFGYSMGGRVAFGFAKYAPERVKSLIIGGMSPYGNIPFDLNQRIEFLKDGMHLTVDNYEKNYGKLPKNVRTRLLANDHAALTADTVDTIEWNGLEDILPRMRLPILYFVGENDYFLEQSKEAAALIENIRFLTLPNANHQQAYVKKHLILPQLMEFLTNNPI